MGLRDDIAGLGYRVGKLFWRKVTYLAMDLDDLWAWDSERCKRCGRGFRLAYDVSDETWVAVTGDMDGCLCIECLLTMADDAGVHIVPEDIRWLAIFGRDGLHGDIVPMIVADR